VSRGAPTLGAGSGAIGEPNRAEQERALATRLRRAEEVGARARDAASQGLIFGVLLFLIGFFSIVLPNQFPTAFNIRSMGISASVIALLAIGQTYVIIGGGIDLSVGSVLVFSGVVAAKLMAAMGPGAPLATLIVVGAGVAIVTGAAWGLLNGFLVVRTRIPDLIVTLGTMGIALGLAQVLTNGVDVSVPLVLTTQLGNGNAIGVIPWLVVIALVVAAIMQVTLSATRFGRHTFAVGSNREAGRRVGLRVDAHRMKLYAISGLLAGLGGFLSLALYTNTTIAGHSTDNLVSIAAVIIGGTSLFGGMGSVLRSVAGVLVPVVLQNGFVIMGLQPFWQPVAIGIVLLAAVYIDVRRRSRG